MPIVFNCVKSPSESYRESGLSIIAASTDLILDQDPAIIKELFVALVQDPSVAVRVAAVKAACFYLLRVPKKTRQFMEVLVPMMFQVFSSEFPVNFKVFCECFFY